jgi:hypothetical protein
MATEIQKGSAVLHGIRSNGTPIDIDYDAFIETAKVAHDFKVEEITDELGFDAARVAVNPKKECDIVLIPKGTSRAEAEEATIFLDPLDTITFANFAVSAFNGPWTYEGGSIDLSHSTGKVSLKFRRYDDDDQNTSLSTTVSG